MRRSGHLFPPSSSSTSLAAHRLFLVSNRNILVKTNSNKTFLLKIMTLSSDNSPAFSTLSFTPTCDLYDKYLEEARVLALDWRSFGKRKQFCGPAYTIQCLQDNSWLKEVVEQPGHGRVLVVQAGGSRHCAMMGDVLAKAAADNHWAGVIIHGCVRDVDELAKIDIGIHALGCVPRKSTRRGQGISQLEIEIGGVVVRPNDFVFADNDGALVLDPNVYNQQLPTISM